jgi:ribonuclease HII
MTDIICGIDEAGRGPLVGNVVAGAVILDPTRPILGIKDSKKLSAVKREALYHTIKENALAWGIGHATPEEIDRINILQATMLAMQRALQNLMERFQITPSLVLVDGNRTPVIDIPAQAIIQGDASQPCISAASILAKVTRDHEMISLHQQYPQYGFDQHMGYPTPQHLEKISTIGLIPGYRLSFGPVRKIFNGNDHA